MLSPVSKTNTTHWLHRILASPGSELVCVEAAPSSEVIVFLGESLDSRAPADEGVWLVQASACSAGVAQLNGYGSPSTLYAFIDASSEVNCTFCVQRKEILCNSLVPVTSRAVGIAAKAGHEASVHVWNVVVSTPMANKTSEEGVVVGVVYDNRWYALHVAWALGVAIIIAFQFPMLFNVDV